MSQGAQSRGDARILLYNSLYILINNQLAEVLCTDEEVEEEVSLAIPYSAWIRPIEELYLLFLEECEREKVQSRKAT